MTRKDDKIIDDLMAENSKLRRETSVMKRRLRAANGEIRSLKAGLPPTPPPAGGP